MLDRYKTADVTTTSTSNLKVLVVGDASVGKSALVENICSGGARLGGEPESLAAGASTATRLSEWTCGCSLSLTSEVVEVDGRPTHVEVEFWEVGGTQTYAAARPVFYDTCDALILVYDVSNMKSYHNLVGWLFELCSASCLPSMRYWETEGSRSLQEADVEAGSDSGLGFRKVILSGLCPVLFVAHKCDLRPQASVVRGPPARPQLPEPVALLDRLLGGAGDAAVARSGRLSTADEVLLQQLCDFVQRGRHTEASSKEGTQSFDFGLWRDFLRRSVEARRKGR